MRFLPACRSLRCSQCSVYFLFSITQALRCFERAALLFHNRPYLWLRMAECSIAHHRLSSANNGCGGGKTSSSFTTSKGSSSSAEAAAGADVAGGGRGPLPWTPVGKGQHRRVLLPRGFPSSSASVSSSSPSAAAGGAGGNAGIVLDDDTGGSGGASESSNGSTAAAAAAAAAGKSGRRAAAGGGCSLAHASRCLHNVLFLCSARAQVSLFLF